MRRDVRWIPRESRPRIAGAPRLHVALPPSASAEGVVGPAAATGEPSSLAPVHDPRLTPRDEFVFLLHTAAEIEHALLVQYLYAWWSADNHTFDASAVRGVAVQEMAHLLALQNVLRALGAPLNLDREDYPFRTQFYPFPFRLEPLSLGSLAKYVLAEIPDPAPLTEQELQELRRAAGASKAGASQGVNRVGALYAQLLVLLAELSDDDLRPPEEEFQATSAEWGVGEPSIVTPVRTLQEVRTVLEAVARQGEGAQAGAGPSHFHTLLELYRARRDSGETGPVGATPLPTDPNTAATPWPASEKRLEAGRISHPLARAWAQLFNLRYRVLLVSLAHALHLPRSGPAPTQQRTTVVSWALEEMVLLSAIQQWLRQLPLKQGGDAAREPAGPPFELPYTLGLPSSSLGWWRLHRDLLDDTTMLIQHIRADLGEVDPGRVQTLDALLHGDEGRRAQIPSS